MYIIHYHWRTEGGGGLPPHKAKFKNVCFVNMMISKDLSDLLFSQIETLMTTHWSVEKYKN
jgi:hypothetical protein